ncbi:MAG: cysteine desulfurase family protein [Bacteroidales bacterium]
MVIFDGMETPVIYFDNAATTRPDSGVLAEVTACMREEYGNPSSVHALGRKARVRVEESRRSIARLLNVSPSEVFFTSGGTEANNAILWGCCQGLGYSDVITSPLEHPAVLKPLAYLAEKGIRVHYLRIDQAGHIDLGHLEELLTEYPHSLVSLMHANNEIGNLLPVKSVASLCAGAGALFHSDTVQTFGKFDMDMQQLGMDFAVGSAHKFYGLKGAGFMYVRSGRFFPPYMRGGGQERNMRAGTENVYGIAGMAKALELAQHRLEEDQHHCRSLKEACMKLLCEEVPGIQFNGDARGSSLHTILNVSLPATVDNEMLLPSLDIEGICVSSGSACSSGSNQRSHVLETLGVDETMPSLRISFGRNNTMEEVQKLVQALAGIALP